MWNSTRLPRLVQKDLSLIKRRNKRRNERFGRRQAEGVSRGWVGILPLSLSSGREYYHPDTRNYCGTKEIKNP